MVWAIASVGDPPPKKPGVDYEAGTRRLKRELGRFTEERDVSTKARLLSAIGPKTDERVFRARGPVKHAFIRTHRAEVGVRRPCVGCCRVHFSGYCAWQEDPSSHRTQEDARQTELTVRLGPTVTRFIAIAS